MNLSALDMNLVVALDALLREVSVTAAAKRVGLSQPAMSHALLRLREALRDPLLVRVGQRMALTERGAALRPQVATIVSELQGLFGDPPPFEPTTSARTYRVALPTYLQLLLTPGLSAAFWHEAPASVLRIAPFEDATLALCEDRIDLAVGALPPDAAAHPDLRSVTLLQDRVIGAVRVGNPAPRGRVDLKGYLALGHVRVTEQGPSEGAGDELVDALRVARRVAVTVPAVLVAAQVAASSNLCATVTQRVGRAVTGWLPLRALELPFDLPVVPIAMTWHRRFENDPSHAWLRRVVAATTNTPTAVSRPRTT